MRLFVAVNFDDTVRDLIRAALDNFPLANPPWRWTHPDTWHVTLKFIGDAREGETAAIVAALDDAREAHVAFDVVLAKFGGFPSLRAPRVLFYGVNEGAAEMRALAHDVDLALERAIGLATERRAYHAHATVARIKEPLPRDAADALTMVPPLSRIVTRVSSFELMESRLGRTGASYSVVKRFAMA